MLSIDLDIGNVVLEDGWDVDLNSILISSISCIYIIVIVIGDVDEAAREADFG